MWHDGAQDRIVLIADMWHPQLDVAGVIEPMLSDEQRDNYKHACAGTPLGERSSRGAANPGDH